jgi:hypothetical protein
MVTLRARSPAVDLQISSTNADFVRAMFGDPAGAFYRRRAGVGSRAHRVSHRAPRQWIESNFRWGGSRTGKKPAPTRARQLQFARPPTADHAA